MWTGSVGRECEPEVWDGSVGRECELGVWAGSVGRECEPAELGFSTLFGSFSLFG